MKRFWAAVLQAVGTVPPAMRGRVIRHLITLLAGAGLIRGLSADQANAWQGLVEMGLSVAGFGLAIWLSQASDKGRPAELTVHFKDEEMDAMVARALEQLKRDIEPADGASMAGKTADAAVADLQRTIDAMPHVSKYPTGEKGHNEPMNAEIAAREPAPTPAPPPAPFRGGGQ